MFKCFSFTNVRDFFNECESFLLECEVRNDFVIGSAHMAKDIAQATDDSIMIVVKREGSVEGVMFKLKKHTRVFITKINKDAIKGLCEYIVDNDIKLPGVFGDSKTCDLICKNMKKINGFKFRIEMDYWLYKATSINIPNIENECSVEVATEDNCQILRKYNEMFYRESSNNDEDFVEMFKDTYLRYIKNKSLYILKNENGVILSIVAISRRTDRYSSIGMVYTPDEFRGRGYAGYLTSVISKREIDLGKICTLKTNIENKISNYVYKKIGYEVIARESLYKRLD